GGRRRRSRRSVTKATLGAGWTAPITSRPMLAVYAAETAPDDPLSALVVGERPEPEVPDGWRRVNVVAASLNHHDVWSLRGVGLPGARLPMVLGCAAAGVDDDGNEVLVHSVISSPDWAGDETLDPR